MLPRVLTAALALSALLPAQSDVVIRTETQVVLVDAVVTDKKGGFVRDLGPGSFRIWEDGKEQKIASFSLESASLSPERSSKHYIALYFDTSTTSQTGLLAAKQQAAAFVDGFHSPDRYMAVLAWGFASGLRVLQNFTTDPVVLKKALEGVQGSNAPLPAPPNATPAPNTRGRAAAPTSAPPNQIDAQVFRSMLSGLDAAAESLGRVRGRKALVFFSGGASPSESVGRETGKVIEDCNKANVGVYTVGAGMARVASATTVGTVSTTAAPRNSMPAADVTSGNEELPQLLSDGTGGISFLSNDDLVAALGKVAQEQDQYYLISYTPVSSTTQAFCHEIKLKTERADLDVRARKEYCTTKLASNAAAAKSEPASGPGTIRASLQAAWFYEANRIASIRVAMDIDPAAMQLKRDKGRISRELAVSAIAMTEDGTVAARLDDTARVEFDNQQQADAFLRAPFRYTNKLQIPPGRYNLRLLLSDGGKGVGRIETAVDIPAWDGAGLSAGLPLIGQEVHPAADLAGDLDASLLEGTAPLAAKGTELVPAGGNEFDRGRPLYAYLEIYEPLFGSLKAGDPVPLVATRIRIEGANGSVLSDSGLKSIGSFVHPGNAVVPIIVPLDVAQAAPGSYRLLLTAMRQTGEPVTRTTSFQIR